MAASVPNPFMSDFPSLGTSGQATNAAAFGLFEQDPGGVVVGGGINEAAQAGAATQGGDLFSASSGQTDLFGEECAIPRAANDSDGGDVGAETVATATALAAGKSSSTATPPPRPPPPATAANGAPRALSPTSVGGASHGRPAAASATASAGMTTTAAAAAGSASNKSAFDDLNDSIRMALGGSPSRPAPLAQQQQQQQAAGVTAQQQPPQQSMPGGPVAGYGIPTQAQVPVGYGSPAKQPMSGDGNARINHANCMGFTLAISYRKHKFLFSFLLLILCSASLRHGIAFPTMQKPKRHLRNVL